MRTATASEFRRAIASAKRANAHGWMVDVHTLAEYRDMRCFIAEDGRSGVAVKKDGDIVSVFSTGRNRLGKLIPYAAARGGRKLDCYGQGLQNMYARFGAKATGKTPFNEQYAPDDWDGVSHPYIVAMKVPTLDTIVKNYDHEARVDLDKVRTFRDDARESGYDKMITARDASLTPRGAVGLIAG